MHVETIGPVKRVRPYQKTKAALLETLAALLETLAASQNHYELKANDRKTSVSTKFDSFKLSKESRHSNNEPYYPGELSTQ